MDLGIKDKVALVGGASQGLGLAVAMRLAAEGARVVLCARDEERLDAAGKSIAAATGSEVLSVPADLSDPEQLRLWVDQAFLNWGRVDILVTNVGGPPAGTFEELGAQDWEDAFRMLVEPVRQAVELVLPGMKEMRWGRILNITSVAVKQPVPYLILSNSLRAAVVGLAKTLAAEVAPYGITVNNLAPGLFDTERLRALMEAEGERKGLEPEQVLERFTAQVPLGRLGVPEELGDLAAFLCSDRASYITGATLAIDGGLSRGLL